MKLVSLLKSMHDFQEAMGYINSVLHVRACSFVSGSMVLTSFLQLQRTLLQKLHISILEVAPNVSTVRESQY